MDFLKRENMLDAINAQIKNRELNLAILKGGKKKEENYRIENQVKSLVNYLENSKRENNNTRHIDYQIGKMKEKYLSNIQ